LLEIPWEEPSDKQPAFVQWATKTAVVPEGSAWQRIKVASFETIGGESFASNFMIIEGYFLFIGLLNQILTVDASKRATIESIKLNRWFKR
jgi:hypothetical protein